MGKRLQDFDNLCDNFSALIGSVALDDSPYRIPDAHPLKNDTHFRRVSVHQHRFVRIYFLGRSQRTPSRFLLEIPDELLEIRDLGEEARQRVPADEVKSFFASFVSDD